MSIVDYLYPGLGNIQSEKTLHGLGTAVGLTYWLHAVINYAALASVGWLVGWKLGELIPWALLTSLVSMAIRVFWWRLHLDIQIRLRSLDKPAILQDIALVFLALLCLVVTVIGFLPKPWAWLPSLGMNPFFLQFLLAWKTIRLDRDVPS